MAIATALPQPVTITYSADGGITWRDIGDMPAPGWVVAVAGGEAVVETGNSTGDGGWRHTYLRFPGGEQLASLVLPPVPGSSREPLPVMLGGKFAVLSPSDDQREWRVVGSGSTPFATIAPPPGLGVLRTAALSRRDGGGPDLAVYMGASPAGESRIGIFDSARGSWRYLFSLATGGGMRGVSFSHWLDAGHVLGGAAFAGSLLGRDQPDWYSGLPAIIDLGSGTVSPITDFMQSAATKSGGPVWLAVAPGPFVRVSGTGDCLNVRAQPSLGAPVLGCFADGVLLPAGEGQQQAEGMAWQAVHTPAGEAGWAASSFLATAVAAP